MKAWGLTPTQWDDLPRGDQAVILAHEANEAELCPSCGYRLDSDDAFAVVRHECQACQHQHELLANKKPEPGVLYAIRRL